MSILKNINQKYYHNFENKSKFGLSKILHCLMSINSLQYNNTQIFLFCLCNGNISFQYVFKNFLCHAILYIYYYYYLSYVYLI